MVAEGFKVGSLLGMELNVGSAAGFNVKLLGVPPNCSDGVNVVDGWLDGTRDGFIDENADGTEDECPPESSSPTCTEKDTKPISTND
mmetsp:Transcript_54789/g.81353  ORF Transcript_54789/g.81353 Transcript_54789/m.81353 type:complete len:87 (+) Transcript_54789:203-463(+)